MCDGRLFVGRIANPSKGFVGRIANPSYAFFRTTILVVAAACTVATPASAEDPAPPKRLDPAAWGSDHVGQPPPAYMTGDECLFCHRQIGPAWSDNRHQRTIRPALPDDPAIRLLRKLDSGGELAAQTRYLLGSRHATRFLRRSEKYGRLDLLSTSFVPRPDDGQLKHSDAPHWQADTFADRCAGCHTTAVDTPARAFSALSLDCFTCHGKVELDHTKDIRRVFLSSQSREPRHVTSICGQCHLRGGRSRSSGLPYPNAFVAGDNLFRDFQVDFSDRSLEALPAIDRHIYQNARDVAVFGRSAVTCLSCHDVHEQSSEKHQQLADEAICASCHLPGTDNTELREPWRPVNRQRAHSRVCDY